MTSPRTSFHDLPAVRHRLAAFARATQALGPLVRDLYRHRLPWNQALAQVPAPLAEVLEREFAWTITERTEEFPSADGMTTKSLWETADGLTFESVLIGHPSGRTTLCLSCQVGCALGCAFCATGRQGLVRDLSVGEILDQAVWAVETLATRGQSLRNVVFMGMGEPLLNLEAVGPALEALMDQKRFGVAPRFVSVSTCGVTGAIPGFHRRFPKVKLAVSLHAPRQDLRDRLMPGCRAWPLDQLMANLDVYAAETGHRLFFEYAMIEGINDGERERTELGDLLGPRKAHLNLIPYNPSGPNDPWRPSPRATLDRFQEELKARGVATTVRHSAGDAIAAACGQLAQRSGLRGG